MLNYLISFIIQNYIILALILFVAIMSAIYSRSCRIVFFVNLSFAVSYIFIALMNRYGYGFRSFYEGTIGIVYNTLVLFENVSEMTRITGYLVSNLQFVAATVASPVYLVDLMIDILFDTKFVLIYIRIMVSLIEYQHMDIMLSNVKTKIKEVKCSKYSFCSISCVFRC